LFEQDLDSYKAFYSMWAGIPYEQVTKEQRNLAKPPFLGFAYRLGGAGLVKYAQSMGVEMSEEECQSAIRAARDTCPEIVNLWSIFEICAEQALGTRVPVRANRVTFRLERDFLTIELPSGRKLWYHKPRIEEVETPWGQMRPQMTYMGQNQFTKKWERLPNHGGRFVEQITQAIARDVLVHGMLLYTHHGGTVVGHVHDEIIAEEDKDTAEVWLDVMNQCLCTCPFWAPDLLLKSEGYVAREYTKS
jgi:DNA polymerase